MQQPHRLLQSVVLELFQHPAKTDPEAYRFDWFFQLELPAAHPVQRQTKPRVQLEFPEQSGSPEFLGLGYQISPQPNRFHLAALLMPNRMSPRLFCPCATKAPWCHQRHRGFLRLLLIRASLLGKIQTSTHRDHPNADLFCLAQFWS